MNNLSANTQNPSQKNEKGFAVEELSDEQLVEKALIDMDMFEHLLVRYEKKLKYFLFRISNLSEEEVNDVLQEVFLNTWKNLKGFDSTFRFSTWIYRIARNQVYSHFRKKKRSHDVPLNEDIFHLDEFIAEDLLGGIGGEIQTKVIHQALAAIKPAYKEVLILRYFEDKSYEEIGAIIRKPAGTVATLLSRSKKSFHAELTHIAPDIQSHDV